MTLQHPKKPINPEEAAIIPILQKMQGNILKHHGRENAWHIFLQFSGTDSSAIKEWIDNLEITSAHQQLADSQEYKKIKKRETPANGLQIAGELERLTNSIVQFFFLSKSGYGKLGFDVPWLTDEPFKHGMKGSKDFLQDPAFHKWDFANDADDAIDAMLLIASDNYQELDKLFNLLLRSSKQAGIKILHVQKGEILRNGHGIGIEHFGYADGVSQPLLLTTDLEKPGKVWDDAANPFVMALVKDENVKVKKKHDDEAYGSYFVFRKLEQDVAAFKEKEDKLGFGEIGGAYVVGRFEDGTPVTKHSDELHIVSEKQLDNDFDYSSDMAGSKCPYHAHIRMTNPRDLQNEEEPIRIVRRGIPYDESGRNGDLKWEPEGKVGLLFMCYQQSIANQFEVIQGHWANNGTITNNNPATSPSLPMRNVAIDGVIGQGNGNVLEQEYPFAWGEDAVVSKCNFKGFVTMKGGEYFFAPSIPFLKNL